MTRTLERAMTKASKLPKAAQDQLAEQLLEDIDGELRWDQTLASSQQVLEKMASKARLAKSKGKTLRSGFDKL